MSPPNGFKKFDLRKLKCLVVIDDYYALQVEDLKTIESQCQPLMKNHEQRVVFQRFGDANSMNLYLVSELPRLIRSIAKTGVTNPFSVYTYKKKMYSFYRLHMSSRRLELPSTLMSQKSVTIQSWNSCMTHNRTSTWPRKAQRLTSLDCELFVYNTPLTLR